MADKDFWEDFEDYIGNPFHDMRQLEDMEEDELRSAPYDDYDKDDYLEDEELDDDYDDLDDDDDWY